MRKALAGAVVLAAAAWPVKAQAQGDCASLINETRGLMQNLAVKVQAPARPAIGAGIAVSWTEGTQGRQRPRLPTFLVVTAPPEARFEGTGFIALAAGAKGPNGISFGSSGSRVFVPLHRDNAFARNGLLHSKLYRAGRSMIGWAVVSTGACGEQVLARGTATAVNIAPGAAELVLQERFSTGQPLQRIRAHSGRHDLLVYKGRYEVHEVATGAKIIDRPGNDPNFSPTGRFVAAREANDRATEIIDTVSGEKVAAFRAGLLAWARGDSFAFHSGEGNGNVEIVNVAVDRPAISWAGGMSTLSCRICPAWGDVDVMFDFDRGYVAAIGGLGGKLADLFTQQSWNASDQMGDPKTKQPQKGLVESSIRRLYYSGFPAFPAGWNFVDEPVRLSHPEDASVGLRRPIPPDQARLLVKHTSVAANATAANAPAVATGDTLVPANVSTRGLARASGTRSADASAAVAFAHLAAIGIMTAPAAIVTRAYVVEGGPEQKEQIARRTASIEELKRLVPNSAKTMGKPEFQCMTGEGVRLPAEWIDQTYRWQTPQGAMWLVQALCYAGSAAMLNEHDVVLFSENGPNRELRSILKALAKAGEANGAWVHNANLVLMFASEDGRIVVVSPLGQSAAVIDTRTAEREGAVTSLIKADLLAEMRSSADGRHLIQFNTDGGLFVYRVSDGKSVLRGAIVDDEVIVATEQGLYDTTYEGAHAVQVRFAGLSGQFSFHQFESMLRRAGLAKAMLEGGQIAPPPAMLPVPPQVRLTLSGTPKNGQRAAKATATSDRSLKEVRLYLDGRLVNTLPAQGVQAEVLADLPDPGGGRWVTAVAVDTDGLVSLPSAVQIPGAPRTRGKLRAVIAGVDTYVDPKIASLKSARGDAERFAQALGAVSKRSFDEFEPRLLVDSQVTQRNLLFALGAAARATEPDDTLVFFFAGHGANATSANATDLVLVTSSTRIDTLHQTGISWTIIAEAVAEAKGRVVIVLDACHAGLAGSSASVTNDAMVSALFTRAGAPMVVLAASKGRQLSYEKAEGAGGEFTNALVAALTSDRTSVDRDRSGLIDLGELYYAVRERVAAETKGTQTPWLARNGLVGEMSMF